MTTRHTTTRTQFIARTSIVLLCLSVALPSIATCCPPKTGDDMVRLAAVHRCCTAACSSLRAAKNVVPERASLSPPDARPTFFAVISLLDLPARAAACALRS